MKSLKLPVIPEAPSPQPKVFSMDEYLEFVLFNLKYTFDEKAYAWWKKRLVVDVPFVLK